MPAEELPTGGGARVPVPDPTVLTTEQLVRSIQNVRELMEAEQRGVGIRLEGIDGSLKRLQDERLEIPKLIDREVSHSRILTQAHHDGLKELFVEKFAALATLTDKLSLANATALTAALSAAEKAVGAQNRSSSLAITKSEQGMQEALKQLQTTFQTEIKGITSLMATMQSRLDRGEAGETGRRDQVATARDATMISQGGGANTIAVVAACVAGIAVIVSVVLAMTLHGGSTTQYVPAPVAPIAVPR